MLESFISTQKTSVQKAMTKRFRHYLSHAQDLNDLILHALQVGTGLCHLHQTCAGLMEAHAAGQLRMCTTPLNDGAQR